MDTRRSPMRPETGARSSVNSRSSAACSHGGLLRRDCRLRHPLGLRALVEGLLGDHRADGKTLTACEIAFRECEIGPRLREAGLRLSEGDLEGPAIDREQKIALLHDLPVLKMDRLQIPGDTRPHLDGLDGDEAADILILVSDHSGNRLRDRDLRRRGRGWSRFRLTLVARCERGQEGDDHRNADLLHLDPPTEYL